MKFGQFELQAFVEQTFRLDGGTMFGVIPKSIWSKMMPADENNLIGMNTNLFVLKAHGKNMIFDIGLGDTLSDREKKVYGTDGVSHLDDGLASLGLKPSDIDYVILTHLHTDHCGGAVKMVDSHYVPRFPKAKYIIEKKEWDAAIHPDERTSAVYIPERLHPLLEAGQVEFIQGNTQLFPGIRAIFTGGHSIGHYLIEMTSGDVTALYAADTYPMIPHLRTPFVPATDILPLDSMAAKRQLLPRILSENIVLCFDHETTMPFARVTETAKKLVAEPVDSALTLTHH